MAQDELPDTTSTGLNASTVDSVRRPVLWMPSLRDPTLSSARKPTRSCSTTRRSSSTTGTSGRRRLRPTLKPTTSTDKRAQPSDATTTYITPRENYLKDLCLLE